MSHEPGDRSRTGRRKVVDRGPVGRSACEPSRSTGK